MIMMMKEMNGKMNNLIIPLIIITFLCISFLTGSIYIGSDIDKYNKSTLGVFFKRKNNVQ